MGIFLYGRENCMKTATKKYISAIAALSIALTASGLVMPAFAADGISYIERSWDDETKTIKENTVTTSDYVNISAVSDVEGATLSDALYVVTGYVKFDHRLTVRGNTRLLLTDGSRLECPRGIRTATKSDPGLTLCIYGQKNNSGKLEVNSAEEDNAGIGGNGNEKGGTINIHGGTVTATGGGDAAGIGGGYYSDAGNINIYGGTVTATGGSKGAGIGGGYGGSGSLSITTAINIYDGEVTATGGYQAAGIGGGKIASSSDYGYSGLSGGGAGVVGIYGGTVSATGGDDAAGIGTGSCNEALITTYSYPYDVGTVTISGGTVTAQGGVNGAGIGGGSKNRYNEKRYGKISISGGTVTATGGDDGAGIGGGYKGWMIPVSISGGKVTATGGKDAAGIGCESNPATVTTAGLEITGGDVTAKGTVDGAGIGAGWVNNSDTRRLAASFTARITGGSVRAYADKGWAIGTTNDDDDINNEQYWCKLVIGDNMQVYSERAFQTVEKIAACRYRHDIYIVECDHNSPSGEDGRSYEYTDSEKHSVSCKFCGGTWSEAHDIPAEGSICSKCGGSKVLRTLTLRILTPEGAYKDEEPTQIEVNSKYIMPDVLRANVPSGKRFIGWKIKSDSKIIKPYEEITITVDTVAEAQYEDVFMLTASASEGGSVTAASDRYGKDEKVSVSAVAYDGYVLSELSYSYGGVTVSLTADEDGNATFNMPEANAAVSAKFIIPVFSVTVPEGITFTEDSAALTDGRTEYGTELKFTVPDGNEVRVNGETIKPDEDGVYSVSVGSDLVIELVAVSQVSTKAECVYAVGSTDPNVVPAVGFVGTVTAQSDVTITTLTWTISPHSGEAVIYTTKDKDYGAPNMTIEKGGELKVGLIVNGLDDAYAGAELKAE